MTLYQIVIGDWSNDGHGRTETYPVECNYKPQEVQRAIIRAEKKSGVYIMSREKDKILGKYEDNLLPRDKYMKLKEIGVNFAAFEDNDVVAEFADGNEDANITAKDCAILCLEMAKTQLVGLEYKFVELETLFGESGGFIGYGCFYG